ncbi:uncharacterized protein LOC118185918 [Stegodyphus dumicola]|uniref:uncharacterized protein LOC118185918 n=1 Tax=Stegodyphus dumicola TaxID=202533 RepID=UPI0015ADF271|nr:uncharacterized protein LOC118185918 [Stegodyphus dumicola]
MTNHICQLSDFKHQLNELFDAFKNLSKEDQTEAISLIRKLYIVTLNCFFSEAKYGMYDSKSEICKDDYCKHLDLHAHPLENDICFSSDRLDNKSILQLNFRLGSEVNENMVESDDIMKSTIKNEEIMEDICGKVSCSPHTAFIYNISWHFHFVNVCNLGEKLLEAIFIKFIDAY